MEIKRGNKKFYVGEEETPLAELLFSVDKDVIFAEGTEVSKELGGKGVGKLLLKELVDWARKENKKIKPICPFVKAQMEKNVEYHDLLVDTRSKMKLGMVQMSMKDKIEENLQKTLDYCDRAKEKGCDLLFFPEVQLTPFFPQYEKQNVENFVITEQDERLKKILDKARQHHMYISPNIYLEKDDKRYDASLWINRKGEIEGISKMVHILQAEQFYEQDYYHPSEDGFKVYNTEFGHVGIVICFDRHLPESIRACTLMGADLIIIPTANTKDEPLEMFEWEIRVQAMQNQVFIAMCNRVGLEGNMDFAGESILVHPSGDVIYKAGDEETLIVQEIDLSEVSIWRKKRPYLKLRKPEFYK